MSADYVAELDGALGAWMRIDFTTERREVIDYSVVLLVDEGERMETVSVCTTGLMESTSCTDTREKAASSPLRSSTAVPLGEVCARRSERSSMVTHL
jgi:hypothetical protein